MYLLEVHERLPEELAEMVESQVQEFTTNGDLFDLLLPVVCYIAGQLRW